MSARGLVAPASAIPVAGVLQSLVQRKCACGNHAPGGATCEECKRGKPSGLQARCAIADTADVHEQEADRIAEQAMTRPSGVQVGAVAPRIQRFAGSAAAPGGVFSGGVGNALSGPGAALEPVLRRDMEQRIGHDFSQVRIHTDSRAAASARGIDALAYTAGRDIVFGDGQFAPGSGAGKRLLAHELVHVVQQSGGSLVGQAGRGAIAAAPPGVQRKCQGELGEPALACQPSSESTSGWQFQFRMGCDELLAGEEAKLDKLRKGRKLRIHGFASRDGDATFNDRLSCHRANVIADLLASKRPELPILGRFKHGASPEAGLKETPGPTFWRSVVVEEVRQTREEWLDPTAILSKGWTLYRKASNSQDAADLAAAAAYRPTVKDWLENTPKTAVPPGGRDLDRTDFTDFVQMNKQAEFLWQSIDQLLSTRGSTDASTDAYKTWWEGKTPNAKPWGADVHATGVPKNVQYHVDLFGEGLHPGAINVGRNERTSTTNVPGTRVPNLIYRNLSSSDAKANRLPFEDHSVALLTEENGPLGLPGLLDEIARVMAPGGTIVLYNPPHMMDLHDKVAKKVGGTLKRIGDSQSVISVPAKASP